MIIWTPQPKVIEGKKDTYDALTSKILDIYQTDEKLIEESSTDPQIQQIAKQLSEITISPYQTLNIPVIGKDQSASEYFLQKFKEIYKKEYNSEAVIEKVSGHHAIGMAQESDGISVYRPADGEIYEFDASFMVDCLPWIGAGILLETVFNKAPDQAVDYGNRIKSIADSLIMEHKIEYLLNHRNKLPDNTKEGYKMIHFLLSASSWLLFWGSHGHEINTKSYNRYG
jgi:hypothetical protein